MTTSVILVTFLLQRLIRPMQVDLKPIETMVFPSSTSCDNFCAELPRRECRTSARANRQRPCCRQPFLTFNRRQLFWPNAFKPRAIGTQLACLRVADNHIRRSTAYPRRRGRNVQSHHGRKGPCQGCMRIGYRVIDHWHGRQFDISRVGRTCRLELHAHTTAADVRPKSCRV